MHSDHVDSGSESEEIRTVEKQPVLEIETSVLYFTHVFGNYQQATTGKWSAQLSAVAKDI